MSVDLIFFFILGFVTSGFLGLMVGAFVWRRAVRLTRRRYEATTPLTLREIRADKDQMRAEFAMTTRKLERTVAELQAKATNQLKEIAQSRLNLKELAAANDKAEERVADLRSAHKAAQIELTEKETAIDELSRELASREKLMDKRQADLDTLEGRIADLENELSGQRVDAVAKETRIDTVESELEDLQLQKREDTKTIQNLKSQLRERSGELDRLQERAEQAEKRLERVRRELTDAEESLERRLREVKRLKTEKQAGTTGMTELQERINALEAEKVDKEAEIARLSLRIDELQARAQGHSVEAVVTVLEAEKEILEEKLATAVEERGALEQENERLRSGVGGDWEDERRDNAMLRERLNDVAAQVTRMAAALEGNDSVIEKILTDMSDAANDGAPQTALSAKMRALADFADQRAAE